MTSFFSSVSVTLDMISLTVRVGGSSTVNTRSPVLIVNCYFDKFRKEHYLISPQCVNGSECCNNVFGKFLFVPDFDFGERKDAVVMQDERKNDV